jgi:aspartate/methionine/tyrosine aminotransferase
MTSKAVSLRKLPPSLFIFLACFPLALTVVARPWRSCSRLECRISLNYTSLLDIFADILSRCPGWTLLSSGAFYAYVRHPFHNVSALVVGKVLATKYGVVTLPGEFFLPRREDGGFMESRELRFAVANVGEEDVRGVEERLRELKEEDFKGVEVWERGDPESGL